ncbi:MAG: response regulator [Anaerolineaceae bacterium]|nr:MAG: response regulator [Anaerolineaceae bacterium]
MANNDGLMSGWVILIVDDTPDNLIVAKTTLQFHGATVHTAGNGEEGLRALTEIHPTVILLDIRMPKMNGWAMFKSVRENPQMSATPIIAITAYSMEEDRKQILDAGFDGYISKPFDVFNFAQNIQKITMAAIERRQGSQETT